MLTSQQKAPNEKRIAVLISGSGSNLQAILDTFGAQVVLVVSNVASAYGLQRAQQANVATAIVRHQDYASRTAFEMQLLATLAPYEPDVVALAGFMRILTPTFITPYAGGLLNIHPSLLPKYPGLHTHASAIAAKDTTHGATVHFVTEELDGGPRIAQSQIPVLLEDTPDTLAARVLQTEHVLYPKVIRWLCEGRLSLQGNTAILDGAPISL